MNLNSAKKLAARRAFQHRVKTSRKGVKISGGTFGGSQTTRGGNFITNPTKVFGSGTFNPSPARTTQTRAAQLFGQASRDMNGNIVKEEKENPGVDKSKCVIKWNKDGSMKEDG